MVFEIILYFLYWCFVHSSNQTGVLTFLTALSAPFNHKCHDSTTVPHTDLLARDMVFDVVRKHFSVGLQAIYLKCHFEVTVKPIQSQ